MSKKIFILLSLTIFTLLIILLTQSIQTNRNLSSQASSSPVQKVLLSYSDLQRFGQASTPQYIAQFDINYRKNLISPFRIQKIQRKNGHAPTVSSGKYFFILKDTNNIELYRQPFDIPNTFLSPPSLDGQASTPVSFEDKLTNFSFSLTTPWFFKATNFDIKVDQGKIISSGKLPTVSVVNNTPSYSSVNTSLLIDQPIDVLKTTSTSPSDYLDIVITGDKYGTASEIELFHQDVQKFATQLLQTYPYKDRQTQIRIHVVDNPSIDLGCNHWWGSPGDRIFRIVNCLRYVNGQWTTTHVSDFINTTGVPWDKIIVLVNDPYYGGVANGYGGQIAVATNMRGTIGNDNKQEELAIHEFSHLMSAFDEYDYETTNVTPPDYFFNCSTVQPNQGWTDLSLAGSQDYYQTCSSSNWFRSSEKSIMFHLDYKYYNAPTMQTINNYFNDIIASPPPPPISSLISVVVPPNNSYFNPSNPDPCTDYVSGTATANITVSYGGTILPFANELAYLQVFIDQVYLKTLYPATNQQYLSSYQQYSFDTSGFLNGLHTIKVVGKNGLGASVESSQTFYVLHSGVKPGSYSRIIKFNLKPICPNGSTPTNPVSSNYTLFPPSPSQTASSIYRNGYYLATTDSCSNNLYIRLFGNSIALKPIVVPSPFIAGRYFTYQQWAAKANRLNLKENVYTIKFEAPSAWCPLPSPTKTPIPTSIIDPQCPVSCGSQYDGYWCCEAGEECSQTYPDCLRF